MGTSQHEETSWIWEGYLARGELTLLAGEGKQAGKSTLVFGLMKAIQEEKPFLGRAVTKVTRVVYLSEEPDTTIAEKMSLFDLASASEVDLLNRLDVRGCPNLEAAVSKAMEGESGLLVVDTFSFWADLSEQEAENDTATVRRKMECLLEATCKGWSVLVLHHTNSSKEIRGAKTFRDTPDIVLVLHREQDNTRRLEVWGTRHFEHPQAVLFKLVGSEFRAALPEDCRKVLERLRVDGPLSQKDLVEITNLSQPKVSTALTRLEGMGKVRKERIKETRRRAYYIYYPTEKLGEEEVLFLPVGCPYHHTHNPQQHGYM